MSVKAIVLAGYGINCEVETQRAFELAGASVSTIHVADLIDFPGYLQEHHILAVPGGFSFGDDVASGRILANRLRFQLEDPLAEFIDHGRLVIGICNGFQVLVKMGILPLFDGQVAQRVTLTHNDSGRFEDRWVRLVPDPASVCVWTQGIESIELPVRHGEGKFIAEDETALRRLQSQGQIALRYATSAGTTAGGSYPANPNGSVDDVAGICDPSGRIFGLMPHPEAYLDGYNHPTWTRRPLEANGAGLQIFQNGVEFAAQHLLRAAAHR
jgi:phosphoribosylformylglycinamidine synthase